MEAAAPSSGGLNFGALKEPIGFIKVLEFVLSIFAFATTTSHESSSSFTIKCNGSSNPLVNSFSYSYPYDLEDTCLGVNGCNSSSVQKLCLLGGAKSSAEFYVFVGVIVFLYCLGALVLYIVFDDSYRRNTRIVIADFLISAVLTLLWIISSSAWAAGVSDIKMYTDPEEGGFVGPDSRIPDCKSTGNSCVTNHLGNFASLNVSIIFGFLNFLVWVGNLWFLYKETPWFKVQAKPPSQPGIVSDIDPQRV